MFYLSTINPCLRQYADMAQCTNNNSLGTAISDSLSAHQKHILQHNLLELQRIHYAVNSGLLTRTMPTFCICLAKSLRPIGFVPISAGMCSVSMCTGWIRSASTCSRKKDLFTIVCLFLLNFPSWVLSHIAARLS
jgi:hypothetical protein